MGPRPHLPINLYDFWGSTIADELNVAIDESPGANVLVNLASNEYFNSVDVARIDAPIVAPAFLDAKGDGDYKIVSFFAKKARGVMSQWLIKNRITTRKALADFDGMGYRYDSERSTAEGPVFIRRNDA